MSRWRMLRIGLAAVALIVCFYIARGMFWMPAIPSHHGDGSFQDLSRRAGPFALPGYAISMGTFDLANPHQAVYRFTGLPNIGKKCGVYLAFDEPDGRWSRNTSGVGGQLKFDLFDSKGQRIVSVSGRLGEFIWSENGPRHALYKLHQSFFSPDIREQYRLHLSYLPAPELAGQKGFAYLRCGGAK